MKITDILHRDSIDVSLSIDSKDALIDKMMELAVKSGKITDHAEAKKEIFKREKIMSTGVGNGIALPHAKTKAVEDSVGALALLANPVDYQSLDGEPVNLVFLTLGKENNVGVHLRLLSKISRLMNNEAFRSSLYKCKNADECIGVFDELETDD